MVEYGYARAYTIEHDLFIQSTKLRAAGCTDIREEKVGGGPRRGRDQLRALLDIIKSGDVLVVTKIDRLARSFTELAAIAGEIESRGAHVKAVDQPFDTTSKNGCELFALLHVFYDFEAETQRERQRDVIAKAKGPRAVKAAQAPIDPDAVRRLAASGLGAPEIAEELKIGRASVYRLLATSPVTVRHARIRELLLAGRID